MNIYIHIPIFLIFNRLWALGILLDSTSTCDDSIGSYLTSAAFPALGLLLSLDRLNSWARRDAPHQFAAESTLQSPLAREHLRSENMELTGSPVGHTPRPTEPLGAEGYRLLDFSALLEHLIQYLREEELQLAQQRDSNALESLSFGANSKEN